MQLLMQQVQEQQQPREEQTSLMMRQLVLQQQQQQEIHHRFQMKQQHSQPPMQQERQQLGASIAPSLAHDAESSPDGFDRGGAATIHPSTPPAPLPASPLQVFSPPSAGLVSGGGGSVRVTSPVSPVSVSPRLYAPTHPPFPSPVMSLLPSFAPLPPKALYL